MSDLGKISESGSYKSILPCQMTTLIVNWHLLRLVVVQFFPDACFVFRCESGPGFVRSPVVFMSRSHLDIVIELDNLENN